MRSRMLIIAGAVLLAGSLYPAGAVADFSGEGMTSMESAAPAPEPGTYEFQDALETGALPPGPGSALVPSGPRKLTIGDTGVYVYLLDPFTGSQMGSSGEEISAVDVGGQSFRSEIDAGP